MSHSNMVAIVTPIVTLPLMAFWLIMVFRADSHPGYRHRPPLPVPDIRGAVADGVHPEASPQQAGEPAPAVVEQAQGAPETGHREKVPAGR
jgi:hypothetical protein